MRYLKIIMVLTFLLIIDFSNSTAQNVNYGLSVGIIRSSPILDSDISQKVITPETHFTAMAIFEFSYESPIRLKTGLKFFRAGYTFDYYSSDLRYIAPPPDQSTTTISLLAIPVDFNYSFSFLPGLYLSGGFEIAKAISAKYIAYYGDNTKEYDILKDHSKINFLFILGLGFEYELNNISLFIEPEYSRSLNEVINASGLSSLQIERLSLLIGIKF